MANSIQFWLSHGGDYLQLPVNPSSISVDDGRSYNEIEVIGKGSITVPGEKNLRTVSFSSFLPRDFNPTYCEYQSIPDPYQTVTRILSWLESEDPIRLVVTGTDINFEATLRDPSFDYERAGEIGDVYYDFTFVEYIRGGD